MNRCYFEENDKVDFNRWFRELYRKYMEIRDLSDILDHHHFTMSLHDSLFNLIHGTPLIERFEKLSNQLEKIKNILIKAITDEIILGKKDYVMVWEDGRLRGKPN